MINTSIVRSASAKRAQKIRRTESESGRYKKFQSSKRDQCFRGSKTQNDAYGAFDKGQPPAFEMDDTLSKAIAQRAQAVIKKADRGRSAPRIYS